jgi:hypothetical protein
MAMTVSGFPVSASSARLFHGPVSPTPVAPTRPRRLNRASPFPVPAMLAAVLLLVAVVVAPERPQVQEAICQRHNGAEACRVW